MYNVYVSIAANLWACFCFGRGLMGSCYIQIICEISPDAPYITFVYGPFTNRWLAGQELTRILASPEWHMVVPEGSSREEFFASLKASYGLGLKRALYCAEKPELAVPGVEVVAWLSQDETPKTMTGNAELN